MSTTFTWIGPTNGNWAVAANWTKIGGSSASTWPGEIATNDNANFSLTSVRTVNLDVTGKTINNFNLSGSQSLTLQPSTSGNTLTINGTLANSNTSASGNTLSINATIGKITNATGNILRKLILSGTVTLTGTSTTIINTNGTVEMSGDVTIPTAFSVSSTSGAISLIGSVKLQGNTTVTVATVTLTMNAVSGAFSLTKAGTSILRLTGVCTYSGATTISNGTLLLGNGVNDGSIDNTSSITVNSNRTLAFSQLTSPYNFNKSILSNGNIDVSASKQVTITQPISGTPIKSGAGQLTLSAANTITSLTVSSGELILSGSNNSLTAITNTSTLQFDDNTTITGMTAAQTLTNNGTLNINRTTSMTIPYVIAGTGSLTLSNTGLITLTNTNTYSGATTINNGTLANNGSILSSAITVNTSGKLQGIGSCGTTTVNGRLAPGNSVGTLTFTNLTLNSSSTTDWEINDNLTSGRGSVYDAIDVSNNLDINTGATVNIIFTYPSVNFNDMFWQSNQQWKFIDALASNANNFTNVTIDTINPLSNLPLPGSMSNIKQAEDLYIVFTASSGPVVPCFAYNNILKYSLPDDIKIVKQNKFNNHWINVNGLLLTKDHLVKFDDKIIYAEELNENQVYINDELVDLISTDGKFIEINNILVSTKKN